MDVDKLLPESLNGSNWFKFYKWILLSLFFLGLVCPAFAQTQPTITIGTIDPGPYGAGSSIAIPITITDNSGSLTTANSFSLFLSDTNGSFSTTETEIGSYPGFYTTFVNGVIPSNTAPGTYKVRVKSTTAPVVIATSPDIVIALGTGVTAALTSSQTITNTPTTFGICTSNGSNNNTTFSFTNTSTAGAAVTAALKNELTGAIATPLTFVTSPQTFSAAPAHYTIITKAVLNGITGTCAYFLINNKTLTSFSTSGASSVCLPAEALEYGADVTSSNGLQNNFPGNTYRVDWGDGKIEFFTLNKIIAAGNKLSHLYTTSSCGYNIEVGGVIQERDKFSIRIQPISILCGANSGGSLAFTASAVSQPENRLFFPAKACITDTITFANFSDPGQIPGSGTPACLNPDAKYTWYIDGNQVATNQPLSFNLRYKFTAPGTHTIRLESSNTGVCTAAPLMTSICISRPPNPSFSLPGNGNTCLQTQIQPVNSSDVFNNFCSSYRYLWTIAGPATVAYQGGDTQNSFQPRFKFTVKGIYTVRLTVTTDSTDSVTYACKGVTTPTQTIIVNDQPVTTMAANLSLCGLQALTFNDTPGSKTLTTFAGTFQEVADTYTWSVSGGGTNYSFENGTTANSKYPSINFTGFHTYLVTVVHKNNCGSTTKSQQIIINNSPTVSAGPDRDVCYGPFNLNGSINGPTGSVISKQWLGGNGGIFADSTNLQTLYTPSQAELDSGFVTLNLKVVTNILAPCDTILSTVVINFVTNEFISDPAKTICTDSPLNYQPVTSLSGSTFKWTSTVTSGNVTGNTSTASFGIGPIPDILRNTGTTDATVTYIITNQNPSCDAAPDTVIVTVNPAITNNTVSVATTTICSGQLAVITGLPPAGANGTYNYSWEFSTDNTTWSIIPSSNTQDLSYTITDTTWFRRTVISGPCSQASNSVQVIALPPLASNTISANQSICPETQPQLFTGSTPTGGDGTYTYQWQKSENNGQTWADVTGATGINYQSGPLTVTTQFRRLVSSTVCTGPQQSISAIITVTIFPLPIAAITFTSDLSCAPFNITAQNVKATVFANRNNLYSWYVGGTQIGSSSTNPTFPGYTITNASTSVVIRLVVTSSYGCVSVETSHTFKSIDFVNASFTQNITQGCGPVTVQFNNTSVPIAGATYTWDFGNGQTFSGNNPNPVTFQVNPNGKDSIYVIKLRATTPCTFNEFTSTVLVKAVPRSIFSPSATTGCAPFTVTFSNSSPSTSATFHYDFGDGSPVYQTTSKDPVSHTYTINGNTKDFTVKMTATNECGSDVTQYSIRATPHLILPELVVNGNEKEGCGPLTVRFFNNSKNASSFVYDFGDGSPTLTTITSPEIITHTFTRAGNFLVKLTSINGCSDTTTTEMIRVYAQPKAAFIADVVKGCNGLTVNFKNNSVDGFTYAWDFGDGGTSTLVNPGHTFNDAKLFYTLRLIATNILGCRDTSIMKDYINIVPIHANFETQPGNEIAIPDYTFSFSDKSTGNAISWSWNFGDGNSSNAQNPDHTYPDTGRYVVKLIIRNQDDCPDSISKTVRITGVPGYLFIPNSFMPGSASPELRVFRVKGSGISEWKMQIYNKWGQVVWESKKLENNSPAEFWDGTIDGHPAPQGVYVWTISVSMINNMEWKGMSYDGSPPKRTGVIHLLR